MFYYVWVRSLCALIALLSALARLLSVCDAQAQDANSPRTTRRVPLVLLLVDSNGIAADTVTQLSERLSELKLQTLTETSDVSRPDTAVRAARRSAQRTHAALVVWFGPVDGPRELYIYDSDADRLDSRRLPRSGNTTADREELVIIASSTIAALLESQEPAARTDAQAENAGAPAKVEANSTAPSNSEPAATAKRKGSPTPTPNAPPAGTETTRGAQPRDGRPQDALPQSAGDGKVSLLLGYAGTSSLARDGEWQNGAGATLVAWLPQPFHVGASYALLPAQRLDVGESEIEFDRQPLTLGFGLDLRSPARQWRWFLADALLGVDRVTRTTRSPAATLAATPQASRWLFDAGARVGAAVSLVSNLGLYGMLGGKLGLASFDFVAEGEQGNEARTRVGQSAWQLELGLCVSVF